MKCSRAVYLNPAGGAPILQSRQPRLRGDPRGLQAAGIWVPACTAGVICQADLEGRDVRSEGPIGTGFTGTAPLAPRQRFKADRLAGTHGPLWGPRTLWARRRWACFELQSPSEPDSIICSNCRGRLCPQPGPSSQEGLSSCRGLWLPRPLGNGKGLFQENGKPPIT